MLKCIFISGYLISGGEPTKVMVRAEREVAIVGTSVEMIDKV
jgi:hypothetical protein